VPSTSSQHPDSLRLIPEQALPALYRGRPRPPAAATLHPLLGRHVLVVGVDYAPLRSGIAPHTTGLAEHLAEMAASVSVLAGRPEHPAGDPAGDHGRPGPNCRSGHPLHAGARLRTIAPGAPTTADRPAPVVLRLRRGAVRREGSPRRAGDELSFLTAALSTALPHVPDLVLAVTPGLGGAVAAARIARRHAAALVVVAHDLVSTRAGGRYTARAVRIAAAGEGRLLRQAAEVAVVSPGLFGPAREHGVPIEHLHLLPHWTPPPPATDDRATARKALGWPTRAFTVVHAGTMGPVQDLGTLVEAARLFEGQIHVVLIGDGPRRAALREQARGVRGLRFVDPLDDAGYALALAAADLLVVAERPDADGVCLPGKLTAYFGAGRAVLAAVPERSAVAAAVESSDGAGLVIRPNDPELMAAAVRALMLDGPLRLSMGHAGLRFAHRRLDRAAAMHRLDAIIESALAT
jgi:glycosyltransferase involved in cell wall biosynthesis